VAQNTRSVRCDRSAHHAARRLEVSQWKRKRVEEIFGWLKTVGLLRKTRHRAGHGELDVRLRLGGL